MKQWTTVKLNQKKSGVNGDVWANPNETVKSNQINQLPILRITWVYLYITVLFYIQKVFFKKSREKP